MAIKFTNTDNDYKKLSAEELLAAEEEVRKNRKSEMLKRAVKGGVFQSAGVKFKATGTKGGPSGRIAKLYGARVREDGGIVEALNCVISSLDKLYHS